MEAITNVPSTPNRVEKRKSLLVNVSQSAQSSTADHDGGGSGSRPMSSSGAGLWLSSGVQGGSASESASRSDVMSKRNSKQRTEPVVTFAKTKEAAMVEAALLQSTLNNKENVSARTPRSYHISPRLMQGGEQAAIVQDRTSDGSVEEWEWKLRSETINASASGDVDLDLSFDFASQLETERRRRTRPEEPASPLSTRSINASPGGMASAKWTSRHRKEPPAPLPLFSKKFNKQAVKSVFSPFDDAPLATTPLSATRRGVDSGLMNALADENRAPTLQQTQGLQPSSSQTSSLVDLATARDADEVSSIVRMQRQEAIERQQHRKNKDTKAKSNSVSPKKLKTKRSIPTGFSSHGAASESTGGVNSEQQQQQKNGGLMLSPAKKLRKKGSVMALGENNNRHNIQMGNKAQNSAVQQEEDDYDFRKHLKKQASIASSIGAGTGTAASFVTADGSTRTGGLQGKSASTGRTRGNSVASTDTWKTAETKASHAQTEDTFLPALPSFLEQEGSALGLFDGSTFTNNDSSSQTTLQQQSSSSTSTRVLLEPMSAPLLLGQSLLPTISGSPAPQGSDLSSPMTPFSALFSEPGTGRGPGSDFTHATAPPSEAATTPASMGFARLSYDEGKGRRPSLDAAASSAMARAATTTASSATRTASNGLQNNVISEEESSVDRMTASAPAKAFMVELPRVDTETWIRQQNGRSASEDSNGGAAESATSTSDSSDFSAKGRGPMILDTRATPTEGERFFATATDAASQEPRSPLLLSPSLAATATISDDTKDSTARKRMPSQLGPIKDMRVMTSPEASAAAIGLGLDFGNGGAEEDGKGLQRSKSMQWRQEADVIVVDRAYVDVPASVSILPDGTSPAPRLSDPSAELSAGVKLNVMSHVDKHSTSAVLSSPSFSSSLDAFSYNATPLSPTFGLPPLSVEKGPSRRASAAPLTSPSAAAGSRPTFPRRLSSSEPAVTDAEHSASNQSRWSSKLWSVAKGIATGGSGFAGGVLDEAERGHSPSPPMRPLTLLNARSISDDKRSRQRSKSHNGSPEREEEREEIKQQLDKLQQQTTKRQKTTNLGAPGYIDLGSVSAPTSAILPPSPLFQSFGIGHNDEPERTPRSPVPAALPSDDRVDSRSKASRSTKRNSRIRYLPSGLEVRLNEGTSPRTPPAAFSPKLADLLHEEESSFATSPSSRRTSWRGPGGHSRGGSRLPYVPSPAQQTEKQEEVDLLGSPSLYAVRRQSSPIIGSPWLGFEDEDNESTDGVGDQKEDEEHRRRRVEQELATARERLLAGQPTVFPNPHTETAAHQRQRLLRNRSIMSTSTVRHRKAASEALTPPTATVAPLSWTSSRQGAEVSTPSARVWLHKPSSPEAPSQFDVYGRTRGHQKMNAVDIRKQATQSTNERQNNNNKIGNPMVVFVPTSAIENHLLRMTGSGPQADERKRKRMVRRKVLTHHWWSSVLPSSALMNTSTPKKRQTTWSEYGENILSSSKAVFHDSRPSRSMFLLGFMGMPWLWLIGGWYLDQWGEWPQPMEPLLLPEDYMIVKGLPQYPSKELPLVQWQAQHRPGGVDEDELQTQNASTPRTPENFRPQEQATSSTTALSPSSPIAKAPVSRFDDDDDDDDDAGGDLGVLAMGPTNDDGPFSSRFLLRNRFSQAFRGGSKGEPGSRFQSGGRLDVQRDKGSPSTRQRKINQQNLLKPEQRPINVHLNYYLTNPAKLYDAFEDSIYHSTCQLVAGCQQTVSNCKRVDPFVLANRILGVGSMVIAFTLMAWAIYEVIQRY